METYIITVNGNSYEVQVEKKSAASGPAPKPAAAPKPRAPKKAAASAGGIEIKSGAAGKVVKLAASAGASVKAGSPVIIIEAMKMEIPVVAPQDGVVASITVSEGQAVEAGQVVATMD